MTGTSKQTIVEHALEKLATALAISVETRRIQFYEAALKSYTETDLNRAVAELSSSWKFRYFPNPAHIVEACEGKLRDNYTQPKPVGDFIERIRQAEERARKNARDFTERFGQSGLASRAKHEGWHVRLKEHCYAVAEYHYLKLEQKQGNILHIGNSIYTTVNCMGDLVDSIKERQGNSIDPVIELDQKLIDAWKASLPKKEMKKEGVA